MQISALAFLLGILLCQQLTQLPDLRWTSLLLACFPAALFFHPAFFHSARYKTPAGRWRLPLLWRLPPLIIAGFLWAVLLAGNQLSHAFEAGLEGRDVLVTGTIASLPEVKQRLTRFEFEVDHLTGGGQDGAEPVERRDSFRILLSWYQHPPRLQVGQRWRLQVRLKRPSGFMNPGGFDYERWLFHKGIVATGYVRAPHRSERQSAARNTLLQAGPNGRYIDHLRERIRDAIDQALPQDAMAGMVKALAVGDRQAITQAQWQVLLRTGTNHLLAISGLHVGLIAGLAFFLMRWLWSRWGRAVLWLPAPKAAAIAAILAATCYAALAGFAVPTQRALLMVLVIMLALLGQRQCRPSHTLSLALFGVLLLDPMAVLEASFWLSFIAVAVILYGMSGRLPWQAGKLQGLWWRWGRVQWLVAIGLTPVLLFYFQRLSLVAPLANLVAVPWVSLVTVPVTLLGSLLILVWPDAGTWVLHLASGSLQGLWWVVDGLAAWPLAQWAHAAPPSWMLLPTGIGIVWLLAPRGFPARWLGMCWLLPLGLWQPPPLAAGEARLTLLDVGQGLSAVVQTREHALVFDTGPRFSHDFDTGEAVVVPFLRQAGIASLDLLVVSHGDNDHIGGTQSLLAQVPTHQVLSSVVDQIPWAAAQDCRRGQHWQWDGVEFQMLHPGSQPFPGDARENNLSCVLRVQTRHGSALLTGDIEAAAERDLLSSGDQSLPLHADILVVPHHGSRTSSSAPFIQAVAPRYALFPVGYRNRYGFPKPAIVERYLQYNVALLDTARNGAITFELGDEAGAHLLWTWRQQVQRYWHRTVAMPLPR